MRAELLSYLTTALASAAVKVSQELPWNTAGEPLYLKNMKKFYLDADEVEQTTLIPVITGTDVYQNKTTVRGYFAVDAKNQPSGLDTVIATILGAKDQTGLVNFGVEADYTNDIIDDTLVYTFEFRLDQTN